MFEDLEEPKIKAIKKKRKKQILEGLFSQSIKKYPNLLGHKLHNNPLAHQTTHADFEVLNKNGNIYFVEAKESKLNDKGYGSFAFKRLTQRNSLIFYSNFSNYTFSFILLFFRSNTMEKSRCFAIPIEKWCEFEQVIGKKSANIHDINENFADYILEYSNKQFNLMFLC